MEILRCPNGHYYDPSQTAVCPKCAQEQGRRAEAPGATMPATEVAFDKIPDTMPIHPGGTPNQPVDPFGDSPLAKTEPIGNGMQNYQMKTEPVGTPQENLGFGGKVEDYTQTMPVEVGGGSGDFSAQVPGIRPVVGWLVCVQGNNKGCDYRVHNGYNYIGRAQSMDICIPGDPYISNEKAAIVAFDDLEQLFYFGPGMGHNSVRINGKMCLGQTQLNAYDQITLGKTTLVFVPFCGERFDWNDYK